jgi:hypothetical protein
VVGHLCAGDRKQPSGTTDGGRHFNDLVAARRHAYFVIQECLWTSPDLSVEFDIQIWMISPSGAEQLHDVIVVCAERYMHSRERMAGRG